MAAGRQGAAVSFLPGHRLWADATPHPRWIFPLQETDHHTQNYARPLRGLTVCPTPRIQGHSCITQP